MSCSARSASVQIHSRNALRISSCFSCAAAIAARSTYRFPKEPIREASHGSAWVLEFLHSTRWIALWVLLGALLAPAVTPGADTESQTIRTLPVPRPDLARVETDVRLALEKARSDLDAQLDDGNVDPRELAEVFGNTGLLYQAHLILEPAAACYRNAALLVPGDYRWPYYLGYLQQQAGRLEQAAEAYQTALRLKPQLAVAGLRLGGIRLELTWPGPA